MLVNKITNLNCFDFCHAVVSQICDLCQLGHPVSQKYDLYLYQMDEDLHHLHIHVQGLFLELMLKMVTNVLKICSPCQTNLTVPAETTAIPAKTIMFLHKPYCVHNVL